MTIEETSYGVSTLPKYTINVKNIVKIDELKSGNLILENSTAAPDAKLYPYLMILLVKEIVTLRLNMDQSRLLALEEPKRRPYPMTLNDNIFGATGIDLKTGISANFIWYGEDKEFNHKKLKITRGLHSTLDEEVRQNKNRRIENEAIIFDFEVYNDQVYQISIRQIRAAGIDNNNKYVQYATEILSQTEMKLEWNLPEQKDREKPENLIDIHRPDFIRPKSTQEKMDEINKLKTTRMQGVGAWKSR